jgi:hypothetical protein
MPVLMDSTKTVFIAGALSASKSPTICQPQPVDWSMYAVYCRILHHEIATACDTFITSITSLFSRPALRIGSSIDGMASGSSNALGVDLGEHGLD